MSERVEEVLNLKANSINEFADASQTASVLSRKFQLAPEKYINTSSAFFFVE